MRLFTTCLDFHLTDLHHPTNLIFLLSHNPHEKKLQKKKKKGGIIPATPARPVAVYPRAHAHTSATSGASESCLCMREALCTVYEFCMLENELTTVMITILYSNDMTHVLLTTILDYPSYIHIHMEP